MVKCKIKECDYDVYIAKLCIGHYQKMIAKGMVWRQEHYKDEEEKQYGRKKEGM